jgi:hypothetical protein
MNTSSPPSNILCHHCNTHFYKKPAEIKRSSTHFCCKDCAVEYRKSQRHLFYSEVICLNCNKNFSKKNAEIKKTANHYCSSSCAAIINGTKYPKRAVEGNCKECLAPIPSSLTYCKKCKIEKLSIDNQTLYEATRDGKKASRYCTIREKARKLLINSGIEKSCKNCGYDKHVETCHIKSISSFELDITVKEINDLSNLVFLCPNCHWEFDKGILNLNGQ